MKKYLIVSILIISFLTGNAQVKIIKMQSSPSQNTIANMEVTPVRPPKKLIAFRLVSEPEGSEQAVYSIASADTKGLTGMPLQFKRKDFDSSNSISGNSFVAPQSGLYHFDIRIDVSYNVAVYHNGFQLMLCRKQTILDIKRFKVMYEEDFTPYYSISLSSTVALAEGDIIYPSFQFTAGTGSDNLAVSHVSFSGFKISQN